MERAPREFVVVVVVDDDDVFVEALVPGAGRLGRAAYPDRGLDLRDAGSLKGAVARRDEVEEEEEAAAFACWVPTRGSFTCSVFHLRGRRSAWTSTITSLSSFLPLSLASSPSLSYLDT